MSVALFGPEEILVKNVVELLRTEGVQAFSSVLPRPEPSVASNSHPEPAVLIMPRSGVVTVGEVTRELRRIIGPETSLILCASPVTAADRALLCSCGASAIITPESWAVNHIAERILGQLVLSGTIAPNASGPLIGATRPMRDLYEHIRTLAPLPDPILLLGETGAGKELVAHELHRQSGRPDAFIPINCPEIDRDLMNSELFGHEKGAFTSAIQSRKGLLAAAGNGTVFLDEIGELDLSTQAKLLRMLEDKRVRPVGSNRWDDVRARVVMATNRNLERACLDNTFREDLYQRMKGFTLSLPPLRDRKADIPLLTHHFVSAFGREQQKSFAIPDGGVDCLFRYSWPGNVRELRAVVRKAAAYADSGGNISQVVLEESVHIRSMVPSDKSISFDPASETWLMVRKRVQKAYFERVLAVTGGNKDAAAKLSGLSRTQFYEVLRQNGKTNDDEPD